jgi:hypothetical protein
MTGRGGVHGSQGPIYALLRDDERRGGTGRREGGKIGDAGSVACHRPSCLGGSGCRIRRVGAQPRPDSGKSICSCDRRSSVSRRILRGRRDPRQRRADRARPHGSGSWRIQDDVFERAACPPSFVAADTARPCFGRRSPTSKINALLDRGAATSGSLIAIAF